MTCDDLLSFSKEGRIAPAAVCSVVSVFICVGGADVIKLLGGDCARVLGIVVSELFFVSSMGDCRLAGRGIAGAVCTNCANGVTSGMLARRTAAGSVSTFGGDGLSAEDGGVGDAFALGLSPK
jgi:hypothetical protein